MNDLGELEKQFRKFSENLRDWLPDGIIRVDIELLHRLDLLNYHQFDKYDPALTRYFRVIETKRKITLINEEFIVWIVPEQFGSFTITYTLVATNPGKNPHLEIVFASSGVYNSSQLILRVLEKLLHEIHENEEAILDLKKQIKETE